MFFGIDGWYFDNYDNLQTALIEKYIELSLNDFVSFCNELEFLTSSYLFKELIKGVKIFSTAYNSKKSSVMDVVRELDGIQYIEVHNILNSTTSLLSCTYNPTTDDYDYTPIK